MGSNRSPLRRLAARWQLFWFRRASPVGLAICRILFFAGILISRLPARAHDWGRVPERFYKPIGLFDLLNLPVLPTNALKAAEIVWWVALLLSAVGLFTRVSTVAALLLGAYLLGLPNNFGKVGHGDQMTVLIMLILALSRCGDALSIDRWIATSRTNAARSAVGPARWSGDYRWPVRMVWVLMALIFCSAGVTKLVRVGPAWVTSDSFSITLQQAHYGLNRPPSDIGLWIANRPWLCHAIAGGSLLLELAFPLALLHRWLRAVIVPATFLMQLGIGLLMGIWFTPFLFGYLFWLPWDGLVRTRPSEPRSMGAATSAAFGA
jgi:hypothetical protein